MTSFRPLPRLMVAPNGARLKTSEHSGVPVTIPDIVTTAITCNKAGADGIHAHIRDPEQNHLLDSGLYRELIQELKTALPKSFYIQITSESVGIYDPATQRQVMYESEAEAISFSVREMLRDGETPDITRFYHDMWQRGTMVQHILYSDEDVRLLTSLVERGLVPRTNLSILCVLGRYTANLTSRPDDLNAFLPPIAELQSVLEEHTVDWACCAFGIQETDCLAAASKLGGKARIGFENNTINSDGSIARNNAERVKDLAQAIV